MPTEILLDVALILFNGFFALSEMAVMTSRKNRLRQRAKDSAAARVALELAEQPERFLSSVQVWITLLGITATFFGAEAIAVPLRRELAEYEPLARYARPLSIAITVGIITILSVVIGELVPKRLAILNPERVATGVAVPMRILATVAKPAVVFLSACTRIVLRLLGVRQSPEQQVTEEEIKLLVAEGAEQGVIDPNERSMVNRALSLGDRTVDSLMTPRTEIAWLDMSKPLETNLEVMRETPYSRYPVCRGSDKEVVGVLAIKTLTDALAGKPVELFRKLAPPLFVPETAPAMHLLEKFREADTALALVVDEYGDIIGLVTLNDLLGAVFGRLAHGTDVSEATIVQRADGSWLLDGRVGTVDLRELLGTAQLPHEDEQEYRTAAGMMTAHFGRIPQVGEYFSHGGYRFEVVDLDGARIDKLLISRVVPPEPENIV